MWTDAGSRPKRPPAGSSRRSGRARMPGAWRSPRVSAWKKAEAAFEQYERSEAGWKMAHGALSVFRPEGHLNDRAWAEQQIALALPLLSGREWSKVRGFLQAKETLTFLDRLHRQLRVAVPCDRLRAELVRLWWLRRRRPRPNTPVVVMGAGHVAHLVQQVVCQEVDANWREAYAAVSRMLRLTVRASSAVECMNGVLRMHQSRHKTVTQGLLDLKPVLELSRIPWGEAAWPLPLRALGAETAQLSVLGPALDAYPGSRGDLIPSSVKLQSYALGRSRKFRALARGTHATSVAVEEALFWGLSPSSPVENQPHPVHANLFLLTLAWEQRLAGTPGSVTSRVGSGWAHKDLRPVKQPRLRSLVVRRFEPRSGRESRGTGVCHASQSVGKLAGLARETTFEYRHKPPHFSGSGIMTQEIKGKDLGGSAEFLDVLSVHFRRHPISTLMR